MKRAYLYLIDFVLPLPMTALMFVLWRLRTGNAIFAAYTLALGVLFGYIFPGIGTNVLHLWKFNGPLRIGNYFLHHGFMYAPYLSLVFYIAFAEGTPLSAGNSSRRWLRRFGGTTSAHWNRDASSRLAPAECDCSGY